MARRKLNSRRSERGWGKRKTFHGERGVYCVAIYLVDMASGGPEEGGWWYDEGDLATEPELLTKMRSAPDEGSAYAYARRLNDTVCAIWNVGRRSKSSVLSEGVYEAKVNEGPCPKHFPAVRPHYE